MKTKDKGPRPPYVTYATWMQVLKDVKERKPTHLDSSFFRDLGLSDSTGVTVRAALLFLGLINVDGVPTEKLLKLVESEGDDRRTILKQVVEEGYRPIVGGVDLEHTTRGHIQDCFKRYGAEGNVGNKCVTFFLALAKDAGIPLSSSLLAKSRVGAPQGHRNSTSSMPSNRGPAATPKGRSSRRGISSGSSHLASKLPAFDPSWPKEVRDEWLAHHRTLETTMALMDKFPNLNAEWSDDVKMKWFDSWRELLNRNLAPPPND